MVKQPALARNLAVYAEELGVTPAYVGDGLWAYVVHWNPETAALTLQHRNPKNRRPNPGQIEKLRLAMAKNGFYLTGETVLVGTDGNICNGQQRLNAVVASGTTQRILTVFGVDHELVFPVLDHGAPRNLADALYLANTELKNPSKVSICVKNCWKLAFRPHSTEWVARSTAKIVSDEDLLAFHDLHADVGCAAQLLSTTLNKRVFSAAFAASSAFLWLAGRVDRDAALEMMSRMADKSMPREQRWEGPRRFEEKINAAVIGDDSGDADEVIPRRQSRDVVGRKTSTYIDRVVYRALLVKAWNCFYTNIPCSRLAWDWKKEFPLVDGLSYGPDRIPNDKRLLAA